jgi:hypothetical protein
MRRCPPVAGIALRACGLLCLLMAGCIPIGYAYPSVSYVAPVNVGAIPDQVHAFRVDVADDDNSSDLTEKDEYVLHPIPLHRDGSFDPQVKIGVDYGWIWNCITLIMDGSTHHTMMVRLYRPGYQTLEIESWQKNGRMKWVVASSLDEQEQALDDLVSTWGTTPVRIQNRIARTGFVPPRDPLVFRYLAPGSSTDEHRQALHFAASEYERLMREAIDPEMRSRLQEKGKALRQLAAK